MVGPVMAMVEVVISQCLKDQFPHKEMAVLGSSMSSSFV